MDKDVETAEWRRARLAQEAMLSAIPIPFTVFRVPVSKGRWINTLSTAERGDTSRPSLVLLHGWGGALGLWRDNLAGLAEHYTVYAVDLLGWGLSSRSAIPGDMAAVVSETVHCLKQWSVAMGLESFTLVGHSLGGYIAARFALQHPTIVARLVLECASDIVPDERKQWRIVRLLIAIEIMMGRSIFLSILRRCAALGAGPWLLERAYSSKISPEEIEYILACAELPWAGEAASTGRNRDQAYIWDDLHKFQMSVDMILGDSDATIPPRLGYLQGSEMAFSRLKHRGRMHVLKGVDHRCHGEVASFNAAILNETKYPAVEHDWQEVVRGLSQNEVKPLLTRLGEWLSQHLAEIGVTVVCCSVICAASRGQNASSNPVES